MIRVAAVGDVHYDRACRNRLKAFFANLQERADVLLIAGDLTQSGGVDEAEALADDLKAARVPVCAVLGNHDYHRNEQAAISETLRAVGVKMLEASTAVIQVRNYSVGIVGIKGFGGGFGGGCCTEFGEPEMKAFARFSRLQAEKLASALRGLSADFKFALLHYAPVDSTLLGERRELYPFMGSYLLGDAIDSVGVDAVFHGHAHYGTERGSTRAGIPVRNVAQMVIRHAYNIYSFERPHRWQAPSPFATLGR